MGVEIKGDADRGVAKAFGDDLGVDAGLEGEGGVAMAEIVEADLR